jgi:hypothetical protein
VFNGCAKARSSDWAFIGGQKVTMVYAKRNIVSPQPAVERLEINGKIFREMKKGSENCPFLLPGQDSNLDYLAPESALAAKMIARWPIFGRKSTEKSNHLSCFGNGY